jgi:hypothetical protein
MAGVLKFPLDRFITVEFTVHDDASALVLAGDRLVNNAESRVAQSNSVALRDPVLLPIGTAVVETPGSL